jgi:hypothetical protein
MSRKNAHNSVQNKEQVYFVENVEGADFTFYLHGDDNELLLLPKKIVDQDEQNQSSGKRFSYSTKLNVVKLPLTRGHLKSDGDYLLDKLNEALGQSQQSQSMPESAWGNISKNLSDKLIEDIKTNGQEEEKRESLLQKLLEELNRLLMSEGAAGILEDGHFQEAIGSFISGRALICRSYQGKLLSVSFRKKSSKATYKPDEDVTAEYPLSIEKYCHELYEAIRCIEKRGLLVITGATNSSKSEIAMGLMYKYLEEQTKDAKRRPHLVTFEDPVEKLYATEGVSKASNLSVKMPAAIIHKIDYTPREKGNASEKDKDVETLKEALEDALRQTPTVLFVGETRDKEDWRRLIDFAGTGHLIVTTAHAGSLTEAMHKIFEALRVKTPAERSEVANRLVGIVHIKRYTDAATGKKILLPAVWRRTPTGKNALTAEGLSTLLPYRPEKPEDVAEKGCLGRAWFAEKLVKVIDDSEMDKEMLKRAAIEWDLEGV